MRMSSAPPRTHPAWILHELRSLTSHLPAMSGQLNTPETGYERAADACVSAVAGPLRLAGGVARHRRDVPGPDRAGTPGRRPRGALGCGPPRPTTTCTSWPAG